jgi:hypothetical protein
MLGHRDIRRTQDRYRVKQGGLRLMRSHVTTCTAHLSLKAGHKRMQGNRQYIANALLGETDRVHYHRSPPVLQGADKGAQKERKRVSPLTDVGACRADRTKMRRLELLSAIHLDSRTRTEG